MRVCAGLALVVCFALVVCRAQTPACANSSYLHEVHSGGTAVAQYATVLRAHVAWQVQSTQGAAEQLAHALTAAGYTHHEPGAGTLVRARHRLEITGVLRGASAPNATGVQHALRAASGASVVTGVQAHALGTTAVRFAAVLESQELACHDMQQSLEGAERSGIVQKTAAGEEHLQLVVDAEAVDSPACTGVLQLTGFVLNCTHAPSAAPAWTAAAANVTVLARECERNGTVQVVASETLVPPAGPRVTLACLQAGGVITGTDTRTLGAKKVDASSMQKS